MFVGICITLVLICFALVGVLGSTRSLAFIVFGIISFVRIGGRRKWVMRAVPP